MPFSFDALRPLLEGLPPVLMLSSSDAPGAGDGAMRLQRCLVAAGTDVTTCVMQKTVSCNPVQEIPPDHKMQHICTVMNHLALKLYPNRPTHFELYSPNRCYVNIAEIDKLQDAKLVHLHWVAGMVGFPNAAEALSGKHVIWTLHDMNPLTGGCHCTAGCEKYAHETGCNNCPQLGKSTGGADLAAQIFSSRRTGYAKTAMTMVAPSAWLADSARRSRLLDNAPCVKIVHSVDTHVFTPLPKVWARAAFKLPLDRKIILFGAAGLDRWNKGVHILNLALENLKGKWQGKPPILLIFGPNKVASMPQGYECMNLGSLAAHDLAKAYSAADVFVSTSLQEAFGFVTAEAQACGTPGIGFYGTGAEEIIQDGLTGHLVAHPGLPVTADGEHRDLDTFLNGDSVVALAEKIKRLLELPAEEAEAMREHCREHAQREFSPVLQAGRYLRLYRRILELPEVGVQGLPE